MENHFYRTSNKIVEVILDSILREKSKNPYENKGIKKAHLMKYCKLKASTAEKYFKSLEKAGYIKIFEEMRGKRKIIYLDITDLGRKRYQWFNKINSELSVAF